MKSGYTHVSILLDRSGSMHKIKDDVIGGYNSFLYEQKALDKLKMTLTLAQFDHEYEVLYSAVDINQALTLNENTFIPRGDTALYDAAANLIHSTGAALALMPEEERPEKVLIVIITDGKENVSKEQSRESVAALIKLQKEKYNWEFVFIGANQDAFAEGGKMNTKGYNMQYSKEGVTRAFSKMSASNVRYRGGASGQGFEMNEEPDNAL